MIICTKGIRRYNKTTKLIIIKNKTISNLDIRIKLTPNRVIEGLKTLPEPKYQIIVNTCNNIMGMTKSVSDLLKGTDLFTKIKIEDVEAKNNTLSIGEGSFGVVYPVKLHECILDGIRLKAGQYAIKRIRKDPNDLNDVDIKDFIKEFKINMVLNSEYIIKCYGYLIDNVYYYVILELCNGVNLRSKMCEPNNYINEKLIYKWVFQILLGMRAMHTANVAWRDLKPENIMICGENMDVKLIDFSFSMSNTNKHDRLQGTPVYIAPELFKLNTVGKFKMANVDEGKETDIFAFGIMMCELFTKIDIRSHGSPVRYREGKITYRGGEITYPEFISYLPKKTIDNILKIQDSDKFKPMFKWSSSKIHSMFKSTNINVLKDIIFNCTKIEPSKRYKVHTIIAKFKELSIIKSLKLD